MIITRIRYDVSERGCHLLFMLFGHWLGMLSSINEYESDGYEVLP